MTTRYTNNTICSLMFVMLTLVGCSFDKLKDDVDLLEERMEDFASMVNKLNGNVQALQLIIEGNKTIQSYTVEGDTYTLKLSDGQLITLLQGKNGGMVMPEISINKDGYWVINGVVQTVKANGRDEDTPQFRISEGGYWQISYNNQNYDYIKDTDDNKVKASFDGEGECIFENVEVLDDMLKITINGKFYSLPIVTDLVAAIASPKTGFDNDVWHIDYGTTATTMINVRGDDFFVTVSANGWKVSVSEADVNGQAVMTVTAPAESDMTVDITTDLVLQVNKGINWAIDKIKIQADSGMGDNTDILENWVMNGDFEAANTIKYWKFIDGKLGTTEIENAINGISLCLSSFYNSRTMYQDIVAVPGNQFIFSFQGRIMDQAGPSEAGKNTKNNILYARIYAMDEEVQGNLITEVSINSSENTSMQKEVVIPEGVHKIRIQFFKSEGIGYIDDVCLYLVEGAHKYIDPLTPKDIMPNNGNIGNNWQLSFSDEFEGTEVDLNKWNIDNSTASREPRPNIGVEEWYWRPSNVEVKDGNLLLHVYKTGATSMECGCINSANKYHTAFGFFECCMKIANPNYGSHTAFWLFPQYGYDANNIIENGAEKAEVDIVETPWTTDNAQVAVHLHKEQRESKAIKYSTPNIHQGYHTFALWKTEKFMRVYYDGTLVAEHTDPKWIPLVESFMYVSDGAHWQRADFQGQNMGYLTSAKIEYVRVWKQKYN